MASDTTDEGMRELSPIEQLIKEFPNVDPTTIQACYEQVIRLQIYCPTLLPVKAFS